MLRLIPFAAVVTLGASPLAVLAETPEQQPVQEKTVCKKIKGTGWRLAHNPTICKTKKDWEAIAREQRKEYGDYSKSLGNLSVDPR
jgi:hypothetical protein